MHYDPNQSRQLDEVIAKYLEGIKDGDSPDRDKLLAEYPHLADDLCAFFSDDDTLREASPSDEAATLPPNPPASEGATLPPTAVQDGDATLPPRDVDPEATHTHADNRVLQVQQGASIGTKIRNFGDYELLDEIARGGMGIVYKAKQTSLDRIVALKMILSGELAGDEEVQRFRTEAEAAANLDHPGIVPIYEIGERNGQHYFSMGFVEGESLADRVAEGPLAPKEAAQITLKVAEAVAYAHDKGVIHRDLKPANVLLDLNGDPKVTDFGLAKRVESDSDLTRTGAVMGTPSYMPPEQAAGKTDDIGPQADVYSLGAILYCLMTGRPPFQAANTLDTLMQVLEDQPEPPQRLNPSVPRDLGIICLRCLEKNPQRRYLSAHELGKDLERFLAGESIQGTESGLFGQFARVIETVQLHERFAEYGNLLLALSPVMLLPEIWVMLVIHNSWDPSLLGVGQFGRVIAFIGVLVYCRRGKVVPRNAPERQLWAVWAGYLAACLAYGLSRRLVEGFTDARLDLQFYQGFACMAAIAFFTLAPHFWGYCAVIGGVFLLLSFVMVLNIDLAPLEFGAVWTVVLLVMGLRLRILSRSW